MSRRIKWASLLASLLVTAGSLRAQQTIPESLAERARQEQERKREKLLGQTQTVENAAIGLRLVVPKAWRVQGEEVLTMDCGTEFICYLLVRSRALPRPQDTITEADRQAWNQWRVSNWGDGLRVLAAGREVRVAAYPAYDVTRASPPDDEIPGKNHLRSVFVLVPEAQRIYEFHLYTIGRPSVELLSVFEAVLDSFAPLGKASAEETEAAALAARLSEAEKVAIGATLGLAYLEMSCKDLTGKFLPLEQLLQEGCEGTTASGYRGEIAGGRTPTPDPNYDYRLTVRQDGFAVSAVPRRAGVGGFLFLSDTQELHYNPKGAATGGNTVLCSKFGFQCLEKIEPSAPPEATPKKP